MNKAYRILSILIIGTIVINWGEEETSIQGRPKQRVNFYGSLTTQQGKKYTVDNIAIGRTYKKIQVYEMPAASKDHVLSSNPTKGVTSELDLKEIKEIRVPDASAVWKYERPKGGSALRYIEIQVTSRDSKQTKNSYLIDAKRKITCDQINAAGPIEMEVPLGSLQSLVIEGHKEPQAKKKAPKEKDEKKKKTKEVTSIAEADE